VKTPEFLRGLEKGLVVSRRFVRWEINRNGGNVPHNFPKQKRNQAAQKRGKKI